MKKKLFLAVTDLAATQATIPVAKSLSSGKDWEVVTFTRQGTPADKALRAQGFEPRSFESYGYKRHDDIQAMRVILSEESPSVALVGISSDNAAIDGFVLRAARMESIPSAAVCETWPEVWLARYGDRDGDTYRAAHAIFVPDRVSVEIAVRYGFASERVFPVGNPFDDQLAEEAEYLQARRSRARESFGIAPDATVVSWFGTYDRDNPDHRGPSFEGHYGFGEAEAYREYLEALRDAMPIARKQGHVLHGLFRQKPSYGRAGIRAIERGLEFAVSHDDHKDGAWQSFAAMDVVCSLIGGTSLHQAAKLGIPGIFYQPGATAETDEQTSNRLGITKPLYERGALREFILAVARDPTEVRRLRESLRLTRVSPGATARLIRELDRLAT